MNRFYMSVIIAIIINGRYFTYANPVPSKTNTPEAEVNIMNLRDPFWPPGWHPPRPGKKQQKKSEEKITSLIKWDEAASLLRITGLTKKTDSNYIAIIKDYGIAEKGDTISIKYKKLTYNWKITEITAEGIKRKRLSVSN